MMIYTSEEIAEILRKHALWLAQEGGGEHADFSGVDLRGVDLSPG